jgi:ribonuclease HI
MEESINLHFDGSCEPINPGGRMGFGVHVSQNGEVLFTNSTGEEASPRNSNNVAEYRALTIGLEWLIGNGYQNRRVVVKGDSALVINQLNGAWRARGGLYYAEYLKAVELRDQFADITFEWVRREFNQVADDLSRTETFIS